jgi:hypothetical protein
MLMVVLGSDLTPTGRCVMRRFATLAVVAVLISPTVASGQDYTFGDWARDQGYKPGDVMLGTVDVTYSRVDSLDGIGDLDWTTTPTTRLWLSSNQLSSIDFGDFGNDSHLFRERVLVGGRQSAAKRHSVAYRPRPGVCCLWWRCGKLMGTLDRGLRPVREFEM